MINLSHLTSFGRIYKQFVFKRSHVSSVLSFAIYMEVGRDYFCNVTFSSVDESKVACVFCFKNSFYCL